MKLTKKLKNNMDVDTEQEVQVSMSLDRYPQGYYHFIIDHLSWLYYDLSRMGLLTKKLHFFIKPLEKRQEPACNKYFEFYTLLFPSVKVEYSSEIKKIHFTYGKKHTHSPLLTEMASILTKKYKKEKTNKLIFCPRKETSKRFLSNWKEVNKLLKDFAKKKGLDYQMVHFEDLSCQEQIHLMTKTRMLVGYHGAGLVNLIFMKKGSEVIEIAPSSLYDYATKMFLKLAVENSIDFKMIKLESQKPDLKLDREKQYIFARDQTLAVDLKELQDKLETSINWRGKVYIKSKLKKISIETRERLYHTSGKLGVLTKKYSPKTYSKLKPFFPDK